MATFRSYQLVPVAIVTLQLAGCRMLNSTPDKTIVSKFENIDTLMISADPIPIQITDAETIDQLKQLYERANWKPFIDTTPADVVAIKCMQGGEESFRLLFGAGWLIEWEYDKGGIRKSILDTESRDWLYAMVGHND